MQVNTSVNIIREHSSTARDQQGATFPVMFPKNDARGDTYTLKRTVYTSKPFDDKPTPKELTTHKERESAKNLLGMSEGEFLLM